MNTGKLIKTVGLYAKIKRRKKTGKAYEKMKMIKLLKQRADFQTEEISIQE